MARFVVETGAGVSTANAYVDIAFCDARFADRGQDALRLALDNLSDEIARQGRPLWIGEVWQKEASIILATDYIDAVYGLKFKGGPLGNKQGLCFPRDAFEGIPAALKNATAEYAIRALSYRILIPDPTEGDSVRTDEIVKRDGDIIKTVNKVGPLSEEIQYASSAPEKVVSRSVIEHIADNLTPYPLADLYIQPLLNEAARSSVVTHDCAPGSKRPPRSRQLIRN